MGKRDRRGKRSWGFIEEGGLERGLGFWGGTAHRAVGERSRVGGLWLEEGEGSDEWGRMSARGERLGDTDSGGVRS
jgi:hypothetical protein